MEWFDDQRLSKKREVSVGVALFQGCDHMGSIKDDKLIHSTFSTPQVHPTVR
ncbi:MAG: hypothetical protein KC592_03810 [Nitrospira sp.]|nr:hypothetical protein [Nitrospira sp.]MCW5782902.1 hypothetical protein [Nitrospirales bacterium]